MMSYNNQEFYACKKCKEINAVSSDAKIDNQKNKQFNMYCPQILWNKLRSYAALHNVTLGKALAMLLTRAEEAEDSGKINIGGLS
jgi:hypothetical protein